jgi:hypothetical protein
VVLVVPLTPAASTKNFPDWGGGGTNSAELNSARRSSTGLDKSSAADILTHKKAVFGMV